MDKLIASPIVSLPGKHFGYFDVYDTEDGKYRAVPRNQWRSTHDAPEYEEFIFYREGKKWKTEPNIFGPIFEQILYECGFKKNY